MEIPKVKCCKCGEEVTKRQTLHIGNGMRACRSHDETITAATATQENEKKKQADQLKKLQERSRSWRDRTPAGEIQPRCFICDQPGIRENDFAICLLNSIAQFESKKGIFDFFNNEDVKSVLLNIKETRLNYLYWEHPNTKMRLPRIPYEVAKMTGMILACDPCVHNNKLVTAREKDSTNIIETDKLIEAIMIGRAILGEV